ncbi:pentatricopeptide repeat-containing protein At2g19280-like [Asparagus officinalis]|uniref:pentatricopeptide repeat-containing protein At2g19280-like n=1 Tax=Asparagus officinalis TaxID=4686 RepID=UPI00098E0D06|nr:pentatricopeptide repeat-containing protein At2g19280-like [Asparagus officinalis]
MPRYSLRRLSVSPSKPKSLLLLPIGPMALSNPSHRKSPFEKPTSQAPLSQSLSSSSPPLRLTSDASPSYFFSHSQRVSGAKHGLLVTCTVIHIAVSGNMNHVAMRFMKEIAANDEWRGLVLEKLKETSRSRDGLGVVYSMLVQCYLDLGMIDSVIETMRKIGKLGFHPSIQVYNSLLMVLLKRKRMECAWQVFVEMPEWEDQSKVSSCLSVFIQEFCSHGDFESACKLLFGMKNCVGCADVIAYTMVIDALCKRGFLKEATSLLYKLIQMGNSLDTILVSSIIDGYCKDGKLVEAKSLLGLPGRVPDVFTYNSFILTLCRSGNMEEANEIFMEMFDLVLIEACCKIEDLAGAECVFNALKRDGLQPDAFVYNVLINGYSKKGFMHRAYELKYMMTQDGVSPDIVTYNTIMHGLVKRGYMSDCRGIYDELVRRGFSPDKITVTSLIHSYSKEGNLAEAYLIWCNMTKNKTKPDIVTCSALLHGFCTKKRMQDANFLFRKMLGLGLKSDLILYNTLIQGFCNVGDVNEACQLLIAMKHDGILPNNATYRALVRGLERKGVENAEEIASMKMQDAYIKSGFVLDDSTYCVHAFA